MSWTRTGVPFVLSCRGDAPEDVMTEPNPARAEDNSSELHEEGILTALRQVIDPDLHKDIVTLGFVQNLVIDGNDVRFTLELTTPACPVRQTFIDNCKARIQEAFPQVGEIDIELTAQVRKDPTLARGQYLPGVKNAILVGSGKGGVGKSTVSVNLALSLASQGAKVGLLDADVYGPSIPTMLDLHEARIQGEGKTMFAVEKHGLKIVSVGFMTAPGQPLAMRGPMLLGIITQFLGSVDWGELDYLIIDLPPGTGDVQLSLTQNLKATGAVIVTTPQDVALADVARAVGMFRIPQLNVPILGVVENMSMFCCPACGTETPIFLSGGGERAAAEYGVPFLGQIPLEPSIPPSGDRGMPVVVAEPDGPVAQHFLKVAGNLVRNLHHLEPAAEEEQQGVG